LLRHYATSLKVAGLLPDEVIEFIFSVYLILPLSPGVYSASNIYEYQKQKKMFLGSRALPVRRADNRTVICEPIV
jgi:hypothetical protein